MNAGRQWLSGLLIDHHHRTMNRSVQILRKKIEKNSTIVSESNGFLTKSVSSIFRNITQTKYLR